MNKTIKKIQALSNNEVIVNSIVGVSFSLFTFLTLVSLQIFNFSHATTDVAAVVTQTGYYINTSSSSLNNSITLSVDATPGGAMAMAKDVLNVKSNTPNGYAVYLSMNPREGCVSDCSALKLDNSSDVISAVSGSFSAPTNLSANTWGYAIKNNMIGAPTNGFSSNYNEMVPNESTLWAAFPLSGDDQLIQTISEPNSSAGIDAEIYYGTMVNTALPSGVYRGEITYTVVSRDVNGVVDILNVSPSVSNKLEGGERLTIATDYTFSLENLGDVKVYMNSLTTSKECTNVETVIEDGRIKISCDAPAYDTGKYDIRVVIPGYSKDVTAAKAIAYSVDSTEPKNLTNVLLESFDDSTLGMAFPSGYYGGDTISLSDFVSTYTQDYDKENTAEQNTQEAGVSWDPDEGTLIIEEGYHKRQVIPLDAAPPKRTITWSTLSVSQVVHYWSGENDSNEHESPQQQFPNTASHSTTNDGSMKTLIVEVPNKVRNSSGGCTGYPGNVSFRVSGTRDDGTTYNSGSISNWTSQLTFDVSELTSYSYSFSLTDSSYTHPHGTYDCYSQASANVRVGVANYVPE